MRNFGHLLAFAAASLVGTTVIAGTAHAQNPSAPPAGYYVAIPAAAPAKQTIVVRETLWKLRGTAYVADRAPERDAYLCSSVARSVGALSSFTVAGRAYDADQLAGCNAHARGGAAPAAVASAR